MRTSKFDTGRAVLAVIICLLIILPGSLFAQNKGEMPITTKSDQARKLFLKGRFHAQVGEIPASTELFDKALELDPDFAIAHLYRANTGTGGRKTVSKHEEKAKSLAGNISEGEKLLIKFYFAYGDRNLDKLETVINNLLKLYPEDPVIRYWNGYRLQYLLRDYDKAVAQYNRAIDLDNNFAAAYKFKGYCYIVKGDLDASEKAFKKYVDIHPEGVDAHDSYAEVLRRQGKFDESIKHYKKAIELGPEEYWVLTNLGHNYILKGDYARARDYYQKNFDETSRKLGKRASIFWKAVSYVWEKDIDKALSILDDYIDFCVKNDFHNQIIRGNINKGFILAESGKPAEGKKFFMKAKALLDKPDFPEANRKVVGPNMDSWICYALIANNELDAAEKELEKRKTIVTKRNVPAEIEGLNFDIAFLAYKKGSYKKAIEYFKKSSKFNPHDIYYLGLAYDKAGNKEKAKKCFKKIIDQNAVSLPAALVRERTLEKLR